MLLLIFLIGAMTIQFVQPRIVNVHCNDISVAKCQMFPVIFNYTSNTPTTDEEAIEEYCPYENMEYYSQCMRLFSHNCLRNKERKYLLPYLQAPNLDDICAVNNPHRDEYKKYASCLRSVHPQYLRCGYNYNIGILTPTDEIFNLSGPVESLAAYEQLIHAKFNILQSLMCKNFEVYLGCVGNLIRRNCGFKIEVFARQFQKQLFSSTLTGCEKLGIVIP